METGENAAALNAIKFKSLAMKIVVLRLFGPSRVSCCCQEMRTNKNYSAKQSKEKESLLTTGFRGFIDALLELAVV